MGRIQSHRAISPGIEFSPPFWSATPPARRPVSVAQSARNALELIASQLCKVEFVHRHVPLLMAPRSPRVTRGSARSLTSSSLS